MLNGIKQRVMIKPGGIIELRSSELIPGEEAEVIVIMDKKKDENNFVLASIIGSAKGAYKTSKEADIFIRSERNKWI
jgi:hypothetical protein